MQVFNLTSEARENLGRYARNGLCLMHVFNLAMSQNNIFVENVNNQGSHFSRLTKFPDFSSIFFPIFLYFFSVLFSLLKT